MNDLRGVPGRPSDEGQSTVEFVLILPLVMLLLLGLIQAGIVLRDQLLFSGAAREAAREAAVTADVAAIKRAAQRAFPGRELTVDVNRGPDRGDSAKVTVSGHPAALPLVGAAVQGRRLSSSAVMRVERPSER